MFSLEDNEQFREAISKVISMQSKEISKIINDSMNKENGEGKTLLEVLVEINPKGFLAILIYNIIEDNNYDLKDLTLEDINNAYKENLKIEMPEYTDEESVLSEKYLSSIKQETENLNYKYLLSYYIASRLTDI